MPFSEQKLETSWKNVENRVMQAGAGHLARGESVSCLELRALLCGAGGCSDREKISAPFCCTLETDDLLLLLRNEDDIDGLRVAVEFEAHGSACEWTVCRDGSAIHGLIEENVAPACSGTFLRTLFRGYRPGLVPIVVLLKPQGSGGGNVTVDARVFGELHCKNDGNFAKIVARKASPRIRREDNAGG